MTTYHKPREFLTMKEYLLALSDIPFQCAEDGYIGDLSGYDAVLRDMQAASHEMSYWRRRREDYPEAAGKYRDEKERCNLLADVLAGMSATMCERYGLTPEQVDRDSYLLRDKRQVGLI